MERITDMIASLSEGNTKGIEEMKKSLSIAGKCYSPQRLKEELDSLHYAPKRVFEKD